MKFTIKHKYNLLALFLTGAICAGGAISFTQSPTITNTTIQPGQASSGCAKDKVLSSTVVTAFKQNLSRVTAVEEIKFSGKTIHINESWMKTTFLNSTKDFRVYFGDDGSKAGLVMVEVGSSCTDHLVSEGSQEYAYWAGENSSPSDPAKTLKSTLQGYSQTFRTAERAEAGKVVAGKDKFVRNWTYNGSHIQALTRTNERDGVEFVIEFGIAEHTTAAGSFDELDPIWHLSYYETDGNGGKTSGTRIKINSDYVDWADPCPPFCKIEATRVFDTDPVAAPTRK